MKELQRNKSTDSQITTTKTKQRGANELQNTSEIQNDHMEKQNSYKETRNTKQPEREA